MTTSCYDPSAAGAAGGCCDACLLRRRGFAETHLADPAPSRSLTTCGGVGAYGSPPYSPSKTTRLSYGLRGSPS
ncbi:MAG TPA: 7-cyano-7-deazaguanine synthase [Candidatus Anammoximicrobium sp.]|nr:7-cyano-7-deazaguanine synthase [Candidatus Anammoximicrobium sp.]